ncbi:MAG TPA: HEAT repeat domain-containing protein [Spirochaetota bacterium]|nr:HEAT repeat domain-containing protein [Spirochaetota bacterium]HPH01415.1 HEAT repeat domain-containing protein [Spirochaetota bacterium]HPN82518.1 HEAT repeat domain-containing protein [Spirochaetota bacterium]
MSRLVLLVSVLVTLATSVQAATNAQAGSSQSQATTSTQASSSQSQTATSTQATNQSGVVSSATNRPPQDLKTVPKKEDLEYWQETMLYGTEQQKDSVLKTMQSVQAKQVDDILLAALANESEGPIQLKLVQILYDRRITGALGPLVRTLTNAREADTIGPAIAALARFKDPGVLPYILQHLTNETLSVQQAAVRALGEIGDPAPGKRLLEMLDSLPAASELRYDLVNALGQMKYGPAYESLRTIAINSGNPRYLRAFAITALGSIGNRKIVPDFIKLLSEEKIPDIKVRIIAALGEMPGSESVQAIRIAMNDGDERIRASAIQAAAKSKDEAYLRPLLYKFRYDNEARVMLAAAEALVELKYPELPALILAKFESTRDVHVMSRFVTILKKLPPQKQAIPMLRRKQKENSFAKVKDEIEALLTLWGEKAASDKSPKLDETKKAATPEKKAEDTKSGQWGDRIYLKE